VHLRWISFDFNNGLLRLIREVRLFASRLKDEY
jgi:hypothetical protein